MEIPQIIQNIYDTFVEYYKEANVDLQTDQDYYYIIVYWSEVVVTNERNLSITIWDLYSRIQLYPNGKLYGKMEFKRACYNDNQWQAKYVHSHVPSRSGYCNWQGCCTGSGPINHTIAKLMARVYEGNSYTDQKLYEDMTTWNLFCWELDKYVHIESEAGGPYKKLVNIGGEEKPIQIRKVRVYDTNPVYINKFILYVVKSKILSYQYVDGKYTIGMPMRDLVLDISNLFIHWYNTELSDIDRKKYLSKKSLFSNKVLWSPSIGSFGVLKYGDQYELGDSSLDDYLGYVVLDFKGRTIQLTKHPDVDNIVHYTTLSFEVIGYILNKILNHINLFYGKKSITGSPANNNDNISTEARPATYQATYIV